MLATKKMTPTDPPNSGPRARLIMTGLERCQGVSMTKKLIASHVVCVKYQLSRNA